ncbi:MAG: hypothetical protein JNK79_02010 [Chitinophagaceae bacterium]|nr:hypothetical protein [Chitinophagaceae bacterium]
MILEIDDSKTIGDLQDRFSLCYPLLKLEFCKARHGWEEICPEHQIIRKDAAISDIRNIHYPGTIEMKSWNKIGEIEKKFQTKFGLNVQICYKSGGRWIQTGSSDNMTIKSLMQKASRELNRVLL